MVPFVLLSPSHSVLKSKGFINIATDWEEIFFFNQVFVYGPLRKRLDYKS